MAHIQNTLIKKQLAEDAKDISGPQEKYKKLVAQARDAGYSDLAIMNELQKERDRIKKDIRCGDSMFLKGVENAQAACLVAIDKIIDELKGEKDGILHSSN